MPDLKALSIYLPTVVQPGGTLTFPFVRVLNENSGTSADQTFWMGIYFSDDKVITTADDRVGECAFPGGIGSDPSVDCASGPFNIAAPLVEGSYRTGTIADYLNDIPETDETNNAFLDAEPIIVSLSAAHPELLVSNLSTPAVTNPGGTMRLSRI